MTFSNRLILLSLFLLYPGLSHAVVYYVAPGLVPTAGTGTEADPFGSIQTAVDRAAPGDTIILRGGSYDVTAESNGRGVMLRKAGAPDNWITIRSYDGERARVYSNYAGGDGPMTLWFYRDSECWNGTSVDKGACYQAYWKVEGLEISGGQYAIKIDAGTIQLIGNDIHGSAYDAIKAPPYADHLVIRNNIIHDTNVPDQGGGANAQGVDLVGVDDVIVAGNYFYNIGSGKTEGGVAAGDTAIQAKGNSSNVVIEGNKIEGGQRAIMIGGGRTCRDCFRNPSGASVLFENTGSIVRNNIIMNATSACIGIGETKDAKIYNNSCTKTASTFQGGVLLTSEAGADSPASGVTNVGLSIRNNIIDVSELGSGRVVKVLDGSTDMQSLILDHNVYWSQAGADAAVFELSGAAYDLAGWKSATSKDVNSRVVDPQYTSTTELTISSTSPAVDTGSLDQCAESDYKGVPRPQGSGCDIGAYEVESARPTAVITASPLSGQVPLTVSFDGSGSTDTDGVISSYAWDFGDGSTAEGVSVSHTYSHAGTYSAELTVTDNSGFTGSANKEITVTGNQAPTANIVASPTSGQVPLIVNFDGSGSSDQDGTVSSYFWEFGDGLTGSGPIVDHTYEAAGIYTAVLTVTDNSGARGSSQVTVTVTADSGGTTTTRWEDSDSRLTYSPGGDSGYWSRGGTSQYASAGNYSVGNTAGATLSFSFNGTGIKWIALMDQYSGQARVTIDGISETVDLYRPAGDPNFGWQKVAWEKSGLANTDHTVEIYVLGTKHPNSLAAGVTIDAFDITSTTPP